MLPQFGFIVAQAGADSHPSSYNSTSTPSQLTKPYQPPPPSPATTTTISSNSANNYYNNSNNNTRQTSNTPHANALNSTHKLPPPLPYMYSNNSNTPVISTRKDYYQRPYQPAPPPPYQNELQYKPLQPVPPPNNNSSSNSSSNIWHNSANSNANESGGYQNHHNDPYYHHPRPPPVWRQQSSIYQQQQQQPKQQEHYTSVPVPPPTVHQHAPAAPSPPLQQQAHPSNQYQNPSEIVEEDTLYEDPLPYYSNQSLTSRWQGNPKKKTLNNTALTCIILKIEEPIESIHENKMMRRIREFNDFMMWMDSEFWEQCDG